MREKVLRRVSHLMVVALAVLGWGSLPQLAQAAEQAVAQLTFNNVSASTALNGTPDSATDVDDVTVAVGERLYLPASSDPAKLTGWLTYGDGSTKPFTSADYTVTDLGNGDFDLAFGGSPATTVRASKSSKVPAMYIKTKNPGGLDWIEESKDNEDEGGSMALVGADASLDPKYNGLLEEMKGRGNTTWVFEKKPYQIKLGASTELVPSAGANKTWILLANYLDAALIRNEVTYNLEGALLKRLGLNDYSIKGQMIDLWIDGGFRGSYYLTEKVQVAPTRVAITDLDKANEAANPGIDIGDIEPTRASSSDPRFADLLEAQYVDFPNAAPNSTKGGYLLEMDFANSAREETSYFITKRGTAFTIKSPEVAHPDQVAFIGNYVQDLEDAIFGSGTTYANYVDVNSIATFYAMQELMANDDAFKSSTYLYMNNGSKLVASPVWDSDRTLGSMTTAAKPEAVHVAKLSRHKPQWIKQLLSHTEFRQAVQSTYRDNVTPEVNALLTSGLSAYAAEVADSARLNKLRWPRLYPGVVRFDTPAQDIAHLRDYLADRHQGMTALFGAAFLKNARLADGVYTIANGKLNVDVAGASLASGANVQLWTPNTSEGQKFSVKRGSDGYYTMVNVNSGRAVAVAGSAVPGANVWQYTANGSLSQKWAIGTYNGATFTIVSAVGTTVPADASALEDGYVLDVAGGRTLAGTNIQIYTDNGTRAQQFAIAPALVEGRAYAISPKINRTKALDVAGGRSTNGANIQLWGLNGTNAQRFTLRHLSGSIYQVLTGTAPGRAMDVAGGRTAPGTNVWQWQSNTTAAQQWTIVPTGDGDGSYFLVSRVSGLYLDVAGGRSINGTNVWTYTGNRSNAQKFFFDRL